jgi:hypothetical protein
LEISYKQSFPSCISNLMKCHPCFQQNFILLEHFIALISIYCYISYFPTILRTSRLKNFCYKSLSFIRNSKHNWPYYILLHVIYCSCGKDRIFVSPPASTRRVIKNLLLSKERSWNEPYHHHLIITLSSFTSWTSFTSEFSTCSCHEHSFIIFIVAIQSLTHSWWWW